MSPEVDEVESLKPFYNVAEKLPQYPNRLPRTLYTNRQKLLRFPAKGIQVTNVRIEDEGCFGDVEGSWDPVTEYASRKLMSSDPVLNPRGSIPQGSRF